MMGIKVADEGRKPRKKNLENGYIHNNDNNSTNMFVYFGTEKSSLFEGGKHGKK